MACSVAVDNLIVDQLKAERGYPDTTLTVIVLGTINLTNLGNFKMTALRKFETQTASSHTDMMGGELVEMFTSGAAPVASDSLLGDATSLFTSGAGPEMKSGDQTGLFTSGAAPKTSGMETGDLTALFTSGA